MCHEGAVADRSTKEKRIVACYFGEGTASEGDFRAGLNLVAARPCPVLFVWRNNGFVISKPSSQQYCGDVVASRGVGYGLRTVRVDGNDVLAAREVIREARKLALSDESCEPVVIEALSYPVSHHSTSDDSFAYMARLEVEDWKQRHERITRLRRYLEKQGFWNGDRVSVVESLGPSSYVASEIPFTDGVIQDGKTAGRL